MLLRLSLWALKGLLVLGVFHYGLPPLVDAATRSSWVKLPVMLALGLGAGAFMAWLGFIPFPTLFIIWLGLNARSLAIIFKPTFAADAKMTIRRPVFTVSSYAYIVVACASAMFLQAESVSGGVSTPLWRDLLDVPAGASVAHQVMPAAMPLSLVVAFIVLGGLVNTHLRHASGFRGSSRDVQLGLTVSAVAGSAVGFGLLVYYGVQTAWYWPVVMFGVSAVVGGSLFGLLDGLAGRVAGADSGELLMSLVAFGWPAAAVWVYFIIRSLHR